MKDRDLAVLPEAGALGFLLGVRSPLRFEHVLPGCVDARVDRDLAGGLDRMRHGRVVVVSRPTPEFGPVVFGRDYGQQIAARLGRDYVLEDAIRGGGDDGRRPTSALNFPAPIPYPCDMVLECDGLGKVYRGGTWGVRELTLRAKEGVLGLLGPNGAGKTTLMQMLATLTRPTTGSLSFAGIDVGEATRGRSGSGSATCPRTSASRPASRASSSSTRSRA